jgi:hypothetical protein
MPAITDQMTYIVICASESGPYVRERDVSDMGRKTTVADIASGQIEDVVQVLECNPVEHLCSDVTKDIAKDVMTVWAREAQPLRDWQFDFVEQLVSMQAAASFLRAA